MLEHGFQLVNADLPAFEGFRELEEMELYHPKTWLGKYVFSQDAKYIAIQYSLTAIAIGVVALVLCSRSVRELPRAPVTPASAVTSTTP
mgnify:CR=1 FL=1